MPQYAYITRRTTLLAVLLIASVAASALAQSPAQPRSRSQDSNGSSAPPLRTLTTLRQAHSLSADQARRGYPIHVRAVVTYYDSYLDSPRIMLFLHDQTGGIYVAVPPGTTWPGRTLLPGTLVDVSGVSAPGAFAPILDQPHITVLSHSQLPKHAKPITVAQLLTGAEDGQWVQVNGVVHSVSESDKNVTLQVAMDDGIVAATTVRRAGVDYQQLVDKWVRIRANAAPTFNTRRQLTGCHLFFPGLESVSADTPDSGDAFARPVQPVNGLLRYSPGAVWPHRVHVSGVVTTYWPGRTICIDDGTEGICARTTQTTPLSPGSLVDLAGFITLNGFNPSLTDAIFRKWADSHPVSAHTISTAQALDGSNDSNLVQMEGQLIGRDLASDDTVLILSSGPSVFRAILPASLARPILSTIPIGSIVRVVGICSAQVDTHGTLDGYGTTHASRFRILARSAQDIVVIHTPSWWTATRVGFALLVSLTITAAGFTWAFALRRRIEQRTRELRESRELYRHMAHHDELTGLPTRTLLHDRLQIALNRAQRFHKGVALLMLDLDHFKQINDSFGHDGGDHVLQITAERLLGVIRKTDSVARMGGDEFIVLLNDLANPEQAELIAEKVVATLCEPILIGKLRVPVSISIGVCTLSGEAVEASTLLKRVDAAMYRAKQRGRGCFQVFTSDMAATINPPHTLQLATAPSESVH